MAQRRRPCTAAADGWPTRARGRSRQQQRSAFVPDYSESCTSRAQDAGQAGLALASAPHAAGAAQAQHSRPRSANSARMRQVPRALPRIRQRHETSAQAPVRELAPPVGCSRAPAQWALHPRLPALPRWRPQYLPCGRAAPHSAAGLAWGHDQAWGHTPSRLRLPCRTGAPVGVQLRGRQARCKCPQGGDTGGCKCLQGGDAS